MPPPLPLPDPDYVRAELDFLDPATGSRRVVTVVIASAAWWPLAGEATDPSFGSRDLTPYAPVVVAVRIEGMRPEPEGSAD